MPVVQRIKPKPNLIDNMANGEEVPGRLAQIVSRYQGAQMAPGMMEKYPFLFDPGYGPGSPGTGSYPAETILDWDDDMMGENLTPDASQNIIRALPPGGAFPADFEMPIRFPAPPKNNNKIFWPHFRGLPDWPPKEITVI